MVIFFSSVKIAGTCAFQFGGEDRGQGVGYRNGWSRVAIIFSAEIVPPDVKDLLDHARAIDQGIDARATAVSPCDRDFLYFETELAGEEKNLGIKSPTLNFLQREDCLDRGLFESLESALGVLELKAQGEAQQQVEDAAENLAVQGLPLGLRFGAEPARTDGDVGAFIQSREKLRSFLNRRGQIGVAEEDDPPACMQHAIADAESFAVVAGIFHQPQDRIFGGETTNNFCGVIAGAVVDDDHFSIPPLGMDVGKNAFERRSKARILVICRNDDAVSWGQRQFLFSFPVLSS